MIFPPNLFTEERQEYDLCDLESLGQLAIDLGVHTHPKIRACFAKLVDLTGTSEFGIESISLQNLLIDLWNVREGQRIVIGEWDDWYALHETARDATAAMISASNNAFAMNILEKDQMFGSSLDRKCVLTSSTLSDQHLQSPIPVKSESIKGMKLNDTVNTIMAQEHKDANKAFNAMLTMHYNGYSQLASPSKIENTNTTTAVASVTTTVGQYWGMQGKTNEDLINVLMM